MLVVREIDYALDWHAGVRWKDGKPARGLDIVCSAGQRGAYLYWTGDGSLHSKRFSLTVCATAARVTPLTCPSRKTV